MRKSLRLLFVVDGRSPIALDWIGHFVERGYEVHLATTFDCEPDLNLASIHFIPVAFSSVKTLTGGRPSGRAIASRLWGASTVNLRTALRRWLAPLTLNRAALGLRRIIRELEPDVVHAMRIPFEGMLAAEALADEDRVPLVVSVWGNDFTLHAPSTHWMAHETRKCLSGADGLHTDCQRDLRLAREWGYPAENPAIVAPGNGGVDLGIFNRPEEPAPDRAWTVINPRGFRAYVCNEAFFKALPPVVARWPQIKVLCPGMACEPKAVRWVEELGLERNVELLPKLSRVEMAGSFRRSSISVSPTTHDGTPNTLLEAMACGCFPIAGDLESIREWITPGENGILVDPEDPQAIGQAIIHALEGSDLRSIALETNRRLIAERAEAHEVMELVVRFYELRAPWRQMR